MCSRASHPMAVDPAEHNPFTYGIAAPWGVHGMTIIRLEYVLPMWARWARNAGSSLVQVADRRAGPWLDLPAVCCTTTATVPPRPPRPPIYYDEIDHA